MRASPVLFLDDLTPDAELPPIAFTWEDVDLTDDYTLAVTLARRGSDNAADPGWLATADKAGPHSTVTITIPEGTADLESWAQYEAQVHATRPDGTARAPARIYFKTRAPAH